MNATLIDDISTILTNAIGSRLFHNPVAVDYAAAHAWHANEHLSAGG
jgi:hypothetical protein